MSNTLNAIINISKLGRYLSVTATVITFVRSFTYKCLGEPGLVLSNIQSCLINIGNEFPGLWISLKSITKSFKCKTS